MTYCPECGSEIKGDFRFCNNCGSDLQALEKGKVPTLKPQMQYQEPHAPNLLVRRNFLIWWLLSYLASPIYMVYYYFNFEDLNKLVQARPNKEGPNLLTDKNNILIYIVLAVFIPFFIIVLRYWKYDKLHNYILYNEPKSKTIPDSGKKQIAISIMIFAFSLVGVAFFYLLNIPFIWGTSWMWGLFIGLGVAFVLVGVGFSFYFIYSEYIWQKAMNEQVLLINPYAEEKTLF